MPNIPPAFCKRKPATRSGGSVALRNKGAAFRRLRAMILDQEPLCRYCRNAIPLKITRADVVDHRIALSLGGSNDPANLVPACEGCNSRKATHERRFIANGHHIDDIELDGDMGDWLRRSVPIT